MAVGAYNGVKDEVMRNKLDIRQRIATPLHGLGVVMLSIICLLLLLWALIIVVRVVLG